MSNEELLYKLWLNIQCGHEPRLIDKCITKFGSAENIYNYSASTKEKFLSAGTGKVLRASRSLDCARELLSYCDENGIDIISKDDERYPKRLSEIYAAPQILYVRGEMPDIDNLICITVVGSRKCSDYGKKFANKLAYDLASSGIVVVSGMADGVDAAAHTGALNAGSITIAALAGGVDVVYPKSNLPLYNNIINSGAVISERPPQTVGRGSFYRERNRILVGLSNGVVIIEGELKSGTKLTATWANESNRDLFAVPGKPDDVGSALPNSLIKDSAKLITSAEDIVSEYLEVYAKELSCGIALADADKKDVVNKTAKVSAVELPKEKVPDFEKYQGNRRIILEYLYKNKEGVHIDEISRECDIASWELSVEIINLMMDRLIKELPGEYYTLN